MKKGFTLITAIVFIVLIATISALALSLSTLSTKQTSDLYLREQAELLLQSSTEFALLAISGHDIVANNNCINTITAQYPQAGANALFDITVSLSYIGNGLPAGCNTLANAIVTTESSGTVIIDTVVETTAANNISTEPIRLHRRTIQKP
jgi:type II secretory pathway pseudopilin PulG